jgi:GAF domain-containing protein
MQYSKPGADIAANTDSAIFPPDYARVVRELEEARQQQAATSEILGIISRSPTDLQPVVNAVAESAVRLCEASDASVFRVDGNRLRLVAHHGPIPSGQVGEVTVPLVPGTVNGRAVLDQRTVHVTDLLAETDEFPEDSVYARQLGMRTCLSVPLMKEGVAIGTIHLRRTETQLFTERQVALLQTFADQAVIAIENARLFEAEQIRSRELQTRSAELAESLEYQTAISEVLKVISSSKFDLQPVLDTLIETATRLCAADIGSLRRRDGDSYPLAATFGYKPEWRGPVERSVMPTRGSIFGRTAIEGRTIHIPDVLQDPEWARPDVQSLMGFRAALGVPLVREGNRVGVLILQRFEAGKFTPKQIELVETFADQAVIAIENTRLFEAEQARTRELQESLEHQTATGEILGVIAASPTDIQPVLQSVAESACRLCEAYDAVVFLREGEWLHVRAHHGPIPVVDHRVARDRASGRAAFDRAPVHVHDYAAAGGEFPEGPVLALRHGYRTILSVPLLREGSTIGVITIRRAEVRPFSDKQIRLIETLCSIWSAMRSSSLTPVRCASRRLRPTATLLLASVTRAPVSRHRSGTGSSRSSTRSTARSRKPRVARGWASPSRSKSLRCMAAAFG